jgi:hypothetical protein
MTDTYHLTRINHKPSELELFLGNGGKPSTMYASIHCGTHPSFGAFTNQIPLKLCDGRQNIEL